MESSLYDYLGVPRDANKTALKAAYRKAVKWCHPDSPGGSAEKFRMLKIAYDVLSDPKRRATYDQTGKIEEAPADNRMSQVLSLISAAFGFALQQCDQEQCKYSQADLIQRTAACLQRRIRETGEQSVGFERHIANLKDVAKRFSRKKKGAPNLMESMVAGQISALEQQRAGFKAQIELLEEALLLVKDHAFKSDTPLSAQRRVQVANAYFFGSGTTA